MPPLARRSCLLLVALAAARCAGAEEVAVPLTPPDPIEAFAATVDLRAVAAALDAPAFGRLLDELREAGCNTVYCGFTPERLAACRARGLKLMIDVLDAAAGIDVRRPEQHDRLRGRCAEWQGDRAVWGYNLSNEPLDRFAPGGRAGLQEALGRLRGWDPSHPVWVGTFGAAGLDELEGTAGVLASCDAPGRDDEATLAALGRVVAQRIDLLGRWVRPGPDPGETARTVNRSLACGMKALILPAEGLVDPATGRLAAAAGPRAVLTGLRPLLADLAAIDMPRQVLSTPRSGAAGPPAVPAGFAPFAADGWIRVAGGEALVGLFGYDEGWDALYVASHDARRPQALAISVRPAGAAAPSVERLDRASGSWQRLAVHDGTFSLELPPGGGELVRLLGVAPD